MVRNEADPGQRRWWGWLMRHWKATLAAAVALACLAVYLRLPKIDHLYMPAALPVLRYYVQLHRQETGDYPRTARDVVEQIGPGALAGSQLRISLLRDNVLLLERGKVRVQYYYVSPDTPPTIVWPVK